VSARASAWLAWLLAGLILAMFIVYYVAPYMLAGSAQIPGTRGADRRVGDVLASISFLAFTMVGALISSRRPRNLIGWILRRACCECYSARWSPTASMV